MEKACYPLHGRDLLPPKFLVLKNPKLLCILCAEASLGWTDLASLSLILITFHTTDSANISAGEDTSSLQSH